MMRKSKKAIPFKLIPVAAMVSCMLYSGLVFSVTVKSTNLSNEIWLSQNDEISVSLKRDNAYDESGIKFVLDKTDVSVLFSQKSPGVYTYDSSVLPLPVGETILKIYQIQADGSWKIIAEYPVQVKTAFGFKESEITPSVNVSIKSELESGYNGDAVEPDADLQKQTSMTTNISLSSNSSNDDFNLQTNLNLVGVSKYEEALRFGEKGFDANKLDLSDYLVQVNNGGHNLSLGHVNFGQNKFLISGFGSRGIRYKGSFGESKSLDFSATKMNGTSIVGYDNISGIQEESNHRVSAASIGYEFIASRPGGLRAEISYLDASILPFTNFDSGEIPDAEKSSGVGLKLSGENESGSLRAEATYASSKYTNPIDPFLFQDDDVVAVEEQADSARHAELSYEIFKSKPDENGKIYSINVTLSHERVDPLYKSLAAFASADTQTNTAVLSLQLADISVQYSNVNNEDNIDDIATVLKTKTDSNDLSISFPFKQIFSTDGNQNNWIPNLDIQSGRVHQYGANTPVTFDPDSHIPDQYDFTRSVRLTWGTEKLNLGFARSVSEQDNRQLGRTNSDFRNETKSVDVSYQFTNNFDANVGVSKVEAFDTENILTTYDDNYSFGFNWGISDSVRLSTSYSEAENRDSLNNATRDGYSGNAQLSWDFQMPSLTGKKMPGQFYISYSMQNNRSKDNVFTSETNAHDWTINAGLNVSLF